MSMDASRLASAAAEAYAAEAKPPLTEELVAQVRDALLAAIEEPGAAAETDRLDRLNAALDAFETELDAVVGPRIASLDAASAEVTTRHRSEAGQPLRAFGGQ
ncbi:hypothetical protein [Methylorubrum salsuginis]|uniref:Uncharacterized protein n=1 Tax=Methylorubrum salsuginis TaxID=414703 RepID=A0A1I4LM38_9HYPH|nr:hypothetical protein [Methylorubrum salsuginis]SFL92168.1 hypothetical protein SAMN04488125_13032 [Methylorubrum salsuginis]